MVSDGRLQEAVDELRAEGIRLAYAIMPWSDTEAHQKLISAGAVCVDRKLRYRKAVAPDCQMPSGAESGLGIPCNDELERLALTSGGFSRFRTDPAMPPKVFEKLYLGWLHRSMNREIADEVLVIRHEEAIAGMVTLAKSDSLSAGGIGLLAVDESHRGKGYGKNLMLAAEAWCAASGLKELEIATQARNAPACGLYAACGCKIIGDEAIFHIWLNNAP
jgi:dTDP-4-amino-4,6-dideoxy-D-galactose acyltransferase